MVVAWVGGLASLAACISMTYKLIAVGHNEHSLSISFQSHLSNLVEALQVGLQVDFLLLLLYEKRSKVTNVTISSLA